MDSSAYVWLDYAMIRSLSRRCRFRYLCLIKPLGPCRKTFIRKNFRINPLQRGLVGKFAFYRHLSRKKSPLKRLFGFAGKKQVGTRPKETTMGYSTVGCIVTLTLSLLGMPLAAAAQPSAKVARIGYLLGTTREGEPLVEAFLEGMRALGYVEGQNLVMEYRYAEGQYERFPDLAAELVRLKVDVLLAVITPAALALKHATTTIPIVMVSVGDPVGSGLVASLARPGGNVTGVASLAPELVGKQLEFLKEALPTVSRVAVLWNPANPANALTLPEVDVAAQRLGVQLHRVEARSPEAFDRAFAAMTSAHAGALLVW